LIFEIGPSIMSAILKKWPCRKVEPLGPGPALFIYLHVGLDHGNR